MNITNELIKIANLIVSAKPHFSVNGTGREMQVMLLGIKDNSPESREVLEATMQLNRAVKKNKKDLMAYGIDVRKAPKPYFLSGGRGIVFSYPFSGMIGPAEIAMEMALEDTKLRVSSPTVASEDYPSVLGRNVTRRRIWSRLEGKKQKEYIEAVEEEVDTYDKVKKAMKGISARDYNLSTTEGWVKYNNDIKKALDKVLPNVYNLNQISKLQNDSISLKGYGKFQLKTGMDVWDYLTAVAMSEKGYKNPDDPKGWLK